MLSTHMSDQKLVISWDMNRKRSWEKTLCPHALERGRTCCRYFLPPCCFEKAFKGTGEHKHSQKGHHVILETSGVPFYASDGTFQGYRGIYRDITERKKIENDAKERVTELERFYEMSVSREVRMKELKGKIENLEYELIEYRR